jgi:hypothetical protein
MGCHARDAIQFSSQPVVAIMNEKLVGIGGALLSSMA